MWFVNGKYKEIWVGQRLLLLAAVITILGVGCKAPSGNPTPGDGGPKDVSVDKTTVPDGGGPDKGTTCNGTGTAMNGATSAG